MITSRVSAWYPSVQTSSEFLCPSNQHDAHYHVLSEALTLTNMTCHHKRLDTHSIKKFFTLPLETISTDDKSLLGPPEPEWLRGTAKLLSSSSEDWKSLAKLLGYKERRSELYIDI